MAYMLVQGGSKLYKVDLATGTETELTLPSGVTLSTSRKPHFALLNQWVVMVNSPSKNLLIDPEGVVTPLVPRPPMHGPSVAAGAGTGLTGGYMFRQSFAVKNSDGEILVESPLSPPSVSVTLANQNASLTDIAISPDSHVNCRRIYRTLTDGAATVMFHVFDIEDNTTVALVNATADAVVTLLPTMNTGYASPPGTLPGVRMKNIVQWKSRLWGVPDDPALCDTIYVSDTNKIYSWATQLAAYPTGQDERGVIGFAVRRNELGFLKRTGLWKVSAASGSTGIAVANLGLQQIAYDKSGCVSEDTIVTINDKVYWLGADGVYEWGDDGVTNITEETVHPWFTTDTYFNRTRFANAFARYNEERGQYELHLAAAGSSSEDRWVSFNVGTRRWYGPHKTGVVTPTHAGHLKDANGLPMTLVGGSNGIVYTGNSSNKRDGSATAIDMDCYGPWHIGGDSDVSKFWGQLSVETRIEASGTLECIPYVGGLNASAGASISHTQTLGRELLRRLGDGRLLRLRFRKNTVNEGASIYGYSVPWHFIGRR